VGLSLAVLAGYGVVRLTTRFRTPRSSAIATAVLVLVAVVEFRSVPLQLFHISPDIPPVYEWLAEQPPSVVLELPLDGSDSKDPVFMYFSTRHWQPLVNGYSGFFPNSYIEAADDAQNFPDDISITHFQRRGVDYVIVHQEYYVDAASRVIISRIEARPELEAVSRSMWQGAEVRVFRLRKVL
jgi:hypothetical protein